MYGIFYWKLTWLYSRNCILYPVVNRWLDAWTLIHNTCFGMDEMPGEPSEAKSLLANVWDRQ